MKRATKASPLELALLRLAESCEAASADLRRLFLPVPPKPRRTPRR